MGYHLLVTDCLRWGVACLHLLLSILLLLLLLLL
jgi:hypothetical protein